MSKQEQNEAILAWAEAHADHLCLCGHEGGLHDDGLDACIDCPCRENRPAVYFS